MQAPAHVPPQAPARHRRHAAVDPGRRRRIAAVAAITALLLMVGASVTAWALVGPSGAVGHDVSYPQCGGALPTTGTFGVVGVNGGRVSTANPCLGSQYAWAAGKPNGAGLYANTGNPGAISTFYWPASGSRDPALCTDRNSAADAGCAYDYGYHGGQDSLRIARSVIGSGASGLTWWLDVELANSWNGSPAANAASLQGATDALVAGGVGTVGVYSTTYQWGQITGGYSTANAASYRAGWAGAFTPRRPLEQLPLWIAGLSSLDDAARNCGVSFTGGPTALAQYTDGAYDGDLVCGGSPVTTPPTTTPTTSTTPSTTTSTPRSTTPPSSTSPRPSSTTPAVPVPTTTTTSPAPTTTTTTTTTTTPRPTTTTTTPASRVPGAPTGVVAATDPVRGITLSWTAPQQTGGSPVTRYAILRGAAPGRETLLGILTCRTASCRWQDTGVAAGAVAYYQVVAINDAGGIGPRSPEVVARAR